jgi:hypothetical protein
LGAKVILRAVKSKTKAQRSCAKKGRKKKSCARHSHKNKNGSQGEPLKGVKKNSSRRAVKRAKKEKGAQKKKLCKAQP